MSTGSLVSNTLYCIAAIFVLYSIIFVSNVTALPTTQICMTNSDCDATALCENGECIEYCERNCDDDNSTVVCGSDGKTYLNDCQLKQHNCLNGTTNTVKHDGRCTCRDHKEVFEQTRAQIMNNRTAITMYLLSFVRTVCSTQSDSHAENNNQLPFPFMPKCDDFNPDNYARTQINGVCGSAWCSTPSGEIIKETYSEFEIPDCYAGGLPCKYDGKTYLHREDVDNHPKGACGCFDGELFIPREQYSQEESKKWSTESLTQLKSDVKQMFYHQYQHAMLPTTDESIHSKVSLPLMVKEHDIINVTSKEENDKMMMWKFDYYDKSGNGLIESSEYYRLESDISNFIKVKTFTSQFKQLIDTNADSRFSETEWKKYFADENDEITSAPKLVKRSIKKLLRTRRSSY